MYIGRMFFPIGDTNIEGGCRPIFSYGFIGLNVLFFLAQISTPGHLVCDYATVPNEIMQGDKLYTLFTSMFMHGGWMHLIGNMMFLWVFADNLEAVMGHVNFVFFYLMGGLAATGIHIFFEREFGGGIVAGCCEPCSAAAAACEGISNMCGGSIPSLGASGAISAVLGSYMVFFPKSRIKVFFLLSTFSIPAIWFLGLWFAEQLVSGVGALGALEAAAGGVAWWAHIGGFLFGLVYGWLNRDMVYDLLSDHPSRKQ